MEEVTKAFLKRLFHDFTWGMCGNGGFLNKKFMWKLTRLCSNGNFGELVFGQKVKDIDKLLTREGVLGMNGNGNRRTFL